MILRQSLPDLKAFFRPLEKLTAAGMLARLLVAFIEHVGAMSASQAAGAIRAEARHRANVVRYLAKLGHSRDWRLLEEAAQLLLERERRLGGDWIFIVDSTYNSQCGVKTENTFNRGANAPRPKRTKRKAKKSARRSCQGFLMGLLLTPSGHRLPSCRCFLTRDYCRAKGLGFRTQTELAAELIAAAPIPKKLPKAGRVYVVGDTSFDAKDIRAACVARGWFWIVAANPERVLAGKHGRNSKQRKTETRPKVRSLAEELQAKDFTAYQLQPGRSAGARQRRLSRFRVGRQAKTRTYHVHGEQRDVQSVGPALVVFSTKEEPQAGKPIRVQKILLTNALTLTAAQVVELYDRRWQIELFFKELKSTLGFARHRFREFDKVAGWTQACLVAFVYLEWRRAKALQRPGLDAKASRFWESQRTYGGCQAVRQQAEARDLLKMGAWLATRRGRQKLRQALRAARPLEHRLAA